VTLGPDQPDLKSGTGGSASGGSPDSVLGSLDFKLELSSDFATAPIVEELDTSVVGGMFTLLDKAIRARRLYHANNPVYLSFVASLRDSFARIWGTTSSLSVNVEEAGFRWNEKLFTVGEGRDNVSFLFYKDGIRYLTFLPTFEEEIERFLDVVHKARSLDPGSDSDMVTILWEKEFTAFQYSYVDALAEGLHIPDSVPLREVERVAPTQIANDLQQEPGEDSPQKPMAMQQGKPSVATTLLREDFQETLYFLDAAELDLLRDEVQLEDRRNIKSDVLNALFDRLEDNIPDRQTEILRILRQLMPAYLGRGDLASASMILVELNALVEAGSILGEGQTMLARELFAELSEPAVLTQLLRSLEEGAIDPSGAELGVFLRHLGSQALALLIRSTETTTVVALQGRLRVAVEQLGRAHPEQLANLVSSDDGLIAMGATRLAGNMALTGSGPAIAKLLTRPDVDIRKAAVEALIQIKSGAALEALQNALDDDDRDVRIGAARGLATLRYQPARPRLEELLQGNRLRDADLTEKIAFFEAFGSVANAESVAMLDKLLNGKNVLRQKQSPEIRACAAMALGKVGSPASRASLERAKEETNPMVRNAVLKALRQEVPA
jgi:HEAT repeat protein